MSFNYNNYNYHLLNKSQLSNLPINNNQFLLIKSKREALDQKLKLRHEFESNYHQLKLQELENEIEDLHTTNQIANKRNEEILNSIQNGIYKNFSMGRISNHSKFIKEKENKKYQNYLNHQVSNIKNEFQNKLVNRHNELNGIKILIEQKLNHNEKCLKLEGDYNLKMAKMNEELANKIKLLNDKNKKVEEERRNLMSDYQQVEEKTKINFFKILEEKANDKFNDLQNLEKNDKSENNLKYLNNNNYVINEEQLENIINRLNKNILNQNHNKNENNISIRGNNKNENKNENNVPVQTQTVLNTSSVNINNSHIMKTMIDQSHSLIKNINDESISIINKNKNVMDNTANLNLSHNNNINQNINNSVKKEKENLPGHNPGVLDQIRKKKRDKQNMTNSSIVNETVEINMVNVKEDKINKNEIITNSDNNNIIKSNSPIKKENKTIQKSNINQKFSTFNNEDKNYNNKNSKIINSNENKIIVENENTSKLTQINKSTEVIIIDEPKSKITKTTHEKLLEDKPDFINIPKDFKLKIIKKLIHQLEKNIKSTKPNNQVYQAKHMNLNNSNKIQLKTYFYEMIKDENYQLNSINTDIIIYLILELMNQNKSPNLIPDNLLEKEYLEQGLFEDLEENIKEIFDAIFEHMKRVVIDKKTSPNMVANILANGLFNFKKDQRMMSNLVAVLEKKLSQRGKQVGMIPGGWGGGFNKNNPNKSTIGSNLANQSIKSMININRKDLSYNTISNFNVNKTNETGGIINNFTEIE